MAATGETRPFFFLFFFPSFFVAVKRRARELPRDYSGQRTAFRANVIKKHPEWKSRRSVRPRSAARCGVLEFLSEIEFDDNQLSNQAKSVSDRPSGTDRQPSKS